MKIERFEDMKAWQVSRVLVKMVHDAVKYNKGSSNNYKFREQIQSAAVSTTVNTKEPK